MLGGNIFGWTVDESTSSDTLDAFVDAGFSAVDTADSYSTWIPGHQGGKSESIIRRWLARDPSRRDRVHVFTNVGSRKLDGEQLSDALRVADENGLPRYQTLQPEYNRVTYDGTLRDLATPGGLVLRPRVGFSHREVPLARRSR